MNSSLSIILQEHSFNSDDFGHKTWLVLCLLAKRLPLGRSMRFFGFFEWALSLSVKKWKLSIRGHVTKPIQATFKYFLQEVLYQF